MPARSYPFRRIFDRSSLLMLVVAVALASGCAQDPDELPAHGPVGPDSSFQQRLPGISDGPDHGEDPRGESPFDGVGDDENGEVDPVEPGDPPAPGGLIPPNEDDPLIKLAPGTNPYAFAALHGLMLLRVLDDDTILVRILTTPTTYSSDPDFVHDEPNQPVILAFGQEITMGFFEGITFSAGGLDECASLVRAGHELIHDATSGAGIDVGIVDTGADPAHPLLVGRVVKSKHSRPLGWIDSANGRDDDGDDEIDEAYGHGTMVAGLVAQVAPGATMHIARALNSDGVGSLADILTGVDGLHEDGVDVVNLSLSLSHHSKLMDERLAKLNAAGIAVVAASGNQGTVTAYPANSPLTIGVAASKTDDALAVFSNVGTDCEVSAPGVELYSAFPEDRYGFGDGTSFAAPIVSGAIALARALGQSEIDLLNTATHLSPLIHGEIHVDKLLDGVSDDR